MYWWPRTPRTTPAPYSANLAPHGFQLPTKYILLWSKEDFRRKWRLVKCGGDAQGYHEMNFHWMFPTVAAWPVSVSFSCIGMFEIKALHQLYKFLSKSLKSYSVLLPWCRWGTFFHTFHSVLANSIAVISANRFLAVLLHAYLFVFGATAPQWAMASSFTRFLDHTQRRTTVSSTPLGEWSARRTDLYLTTHNTHNRQTSVGLLWTSDQPVAQTSTWQHTTLTTDRHP